MVGTLTHKKIGPQLWRPMLYSSAGACQPVGKPVPMGASLRGIADLLTTRVAPTRNKVSTSSHALWVFSETALPLSPDDAKRSSLAAPPVMMRRSDAPGTDREVPASALPLVPTKGKPPCA